MKIVVMPGVYAYKEKPAYDRFLGKIAEALQCDGDIFIWEQGSHHPVTDLPYQAIRDFTCGVILDFQQAVKHAVDIQVPEADIYLGHSAGGVIALAQKDKPCIIFGCPAVLVEMVEATEKANCSNANATELVHRMRSENRPVLNIVNKYDVLAYPFNQPNVENYIFGCSGINPLTYFPLTAHTGYWDNDRVINKIIATIKKWKSIP